ncbi:MAG: hypothetical protein IJB25_06410 [Clostridia bacterium]|nr:hypothetical protein [Clostridia bacterium]MBQ4619497.1 hypothetical protein [Clostridia bacterium]
MVIEFLKVYGVLLSCIAAILALACTLCLCVMKVKKLEGAVEEMKKELLEKMDNQEKEFLQEQKKERRLLNESMSNLSESVTRAVFSIKAQGENKKAE